MSVGNVRSEPSLKSDILYVLEAGTTITAIGYVNEWVKIEVKEGGYGWIYYSLLRGAF